MGNREILRKYTSQWMALAAEPVMAERKAAWADHNDFKQRRPMVLIETCMMLDFVLDSELLCDDPYLRRVEKYLIENIRHAQEVGDDFVLEPYLRIPWDVEMSDFGVDITPIAAEDSFGDTVAFTYLHPIKTITDISQLKPRTFSVDRNASEKKRDRLNEIFGDILPVVIGGIDPGFGADGYSPFCGQHVTEVTLNLYKLIGMDNIYFWLYDAPDKIHQLMRFLTDDFIAFHQFLERENLLTYNGDNALTAGRYGYSSEAEPKGKVELKDLWLWCNAEETTTLSPDMFEEFIVSYQNETAELFGKTYYGCCENIDSRWEIIKREIVHLKAVSVSPFSDVEKMGEMLGKDYIFSRKPHTGFLSSAEPDWDSAKKDIALTLKAANHGMLEIILRDVYRLFGRREICGQWVEMVRSFWR